jgi:UrcA family protein
MIRERTSLIAATTAVLFALSVALAPALVAAQLPEPVDADLPESVDEEVLEEVDDVIEVVQDADEVRVTGSRVVAEGLPVGQGDRIELTYWVSYADLDLAQDEEEWELERRIGAAAEHVCGRLASMYPVGAPEPEACAREAVEGALASLHETAGNAGR